MVCCTIGFHFPIITFYLVYTCGAFRRAIHFCIVHLSFQSSNWGREQQVAILSTIGKGIDVSFALRVVTLSSSQHTCVLPLRSSS